MQYQWTTERVNKLKTLWDEGLSCAEIAKRLNATSRSAVIGKVHRLGLSGRGGSRADVATVKRIRNRKKAQTKPVSKVPAFDTEPLPLASAYDVGRKALVDLEFNECRWPVGDGPYKFCAHDAIEGTSYCGVHLHRAHRAPQVVPRQVEYEPIVAQHVARKIARESA